MRKIMLKAICIFTLVFLVMSMTGAAACGNDCNKKTKAINDAFTCTKCSKSCCFNVLKNDHGCCLKVTSTGCITTKLGGKACIKSNGNVCYTKPASCKNSCTDSFKYCVVGKDGKTSCATVTIKVKCNC
jgi:hypothetical protein